MSVGECVTDGAEPRPAVALEDLREAEVEELHPAVGRDLDVRGLEVAVDDPLLVRRLQRLGDLPRVEKEILRVEEGRRAMLLVEVLALDELHDEKVARSRGRGPGISSNE